MRSRELNDEGGKTAPFPLYERYPELTATLPRLALSTGPSPVRELTRLGGAGLWVKNDGVYGTLYGGNKPRKLELVLPDALQKGRSTIITFGALGTHHGLATALYAREQGLRTVLLLVHQPVSEIVLRELLWLRAAGATLHYTAGGRRTRALTPLAMLLHTDWRRLKRPYLLPPGGSSVLGTVGFVSAGLELAEQVAAGELPEPAWIVVALGSMGTAAGLALGLRLAGLKSRVLAVRIGRFGEPGAVAVLANATADLLRSRGALLGDIRLQPNDITVAPDFAGAGYGHPTDSGTRAIDRFRAEGIDLEPTYTGKTAAAFLSLAESGRLEDGPALYWHTFNALPVPLPEPQPGDYRRLPRAFGRFFEAKP